ncbi:hypothetical protein I5776_17220 [Heyndrickxia vini]|uniref:Uncharacterized protein n=1 Tax=Heyndrickxia vini TaxID=1476025 RepID=A0ABX7DZJ1_9BACI|nr:hypothetical protein I5776_17220 [Heyndrickxia vini]
MHETIGYEKEKRRNPSLDARIHWIREGKAKKTELRCTNLLDTRRKSEENRAYVNESVGCEKEKQRNLSSCARIRQINEGIRLSIDEIVDRNISKWRD